MGSYKIRRRQSKYKQILKGDLDIGFSEEPTKVVAKGIGWLRENHQWPVSYNDASHILQLLLKLIQADPKKSIMIGNAGLVTGVQYEQLAQLFTKYGKVDNLVMIPGKSYSFVVYSTLEDSVEAFNSVNGHTKLDNMDGPLYLVYTLSVPPRCETSVQDSLPEGLTLLNDFVTEEEEELLLSCINWQTTDQESGKSLKNRRVKHFGYEFRYDNNNVDKDSPLNESIPEECRFIPSRLEDLGHTLKWAPDQLTVNQYQKGQGIPSHVDTHSAFESPLLSLSLGSDVVMEFRRGALHVPVLLQRRSMLIMDGEARYAWTHGITPRTMDVVRVAGGLSVRERGIRTSFTLRGVRREPCSCDFPLTCDSQQAAMLPTISDTQAGQLEALYVHQVYNNIASHFSETRTKVWPNVEQFLMSFAAGSLLVDAGCGNGKYFGINPAVFQVGFDRSEGLAEITYSRGYEVFVSDCLCLPLRDNVADGVISVAVLHHLSTPARRVQALCEMCRVLACGGRGLVTVWAKDQTKQRKTAYLKQDRKNRRDSVRSQCAIECKKVFEASKVYGQTCGLCEKKAEISTSSLAKAKTDNTDNFSLTRGDFKLPIHTARTEFQHQDVFVPWKVKSKNSNKEKDVCLRYYHVFEENELVQLCSRVEGINVLETYYTEGNWCVIFEKVKK